MAYNTFEAFIIRAIVNRVDYDSEKDRYIVNNIVLTDEILSKILKFAHQNRIEEGKARDIISNIAKSVSVESEVSYHQTSVNANDIRPGSVFVLFFNNITYGRLSIELLSLNEKRSYLVLDTNIPGLKYKDILVSRNLLWNYGFAVDFGILRNDNYYPGPSNYLLLEKFDGIEYHAPTYIHKVLDKLHIKEQKKISNDKKCHTSIIELIDFVDFFVTEEYSKDNYNILLSEALKCNLSSFQLNILIKRAKYNIKQDIDKQEGQRRNAFFNSDIIRVFQQPIIIKEHEQEDKRRIKELSDEIDLLKGQKNKLTLEVNSLNKKLKLQEGKYNKLQKEYHDVVKKTSNKANTTNGKEVEERLDWGDILARIVLCGFIISILLNLIAPWFIPTVWSKLAVVFSGIGTYFVIDVFDDESKRKNKELLGWIGAFAILLSTILTIYGIYSSSHSDSIEKEKQSLNIIEDNDAQPKSTDSQKMTTKLRDVSNEKVEAEQKEYEATRNEERREVQNKDVEEDSQTTQNEQMPTKSEEHTCVDLGLSVLWASCNVGANLPEEYGDYYAWGETNTKEKYTEENYKWFNTTKKTESGYYLLTKYNSDGYYGYVDNKSKLDPADDVATVKWGKGWRIPTYKEWNELREKCSWKWIVLGNVCGYRVTSPVNNNSIFLPAAGEGGYQYRLGHYWASTISYADWANSIDFDEKAKRLDYYTGYRICGYSVRPVKTLDAEDE